MQSVEKELVPSFPTLGIFNGSLEKNGLTNRHIRDNSHMEKFKRNKRYGLTNDLVGLVSVNPGAFTSGKLAILEFHLLLLWYFYHFIFQIVSSSAKLS